MNQRLARDSFEQSDIPIELPGSGRKRQKQAHFLASGLILCVNYSTADIVDPVCYLCE